MPAYKYRELEPTPEGKEKFCLWLKGLDEYFAKHKDPRPRAEKVRDELNQLILGRPRAAKTNSTLADDMPFNVLELSLDCRNVTLEPEYYGDVDAEKYAERKPLIWFWQNFDRTPVGLNHWLGFRFRRMLAKHIFKSIGRNVKIFHGVEFSFGYNLEVEDDVTIHKYVMLDDRGPLIIRQGSSISDYANIYTHTHNINQQSDVTNKPTEIGPRARLTYHSTVLAGAHVGENAMLAALGLATRPVEANTVAGRIPAAKIKDKDQPAQTPSGGEKKKDDDCCT